MNEKKEKKRPFAIDRNKRQVRKNQTRQDDRVYVLKHEDGSTDTLEQMFVKSPELAESRTALQEMTKAYIASIDFYKADYGGSSPHDEAVQKHLSMNEWRRDYVKGLHPEKVDWSHSPAVIQHRDSLKNYRVFFSLNVEYQHQISFLR